MAHYDKDELLTAIWNNPEKVTGMQWQRRGDMWQSRQRPDGSDGGRQDKTTMKQGTNQKGDATIWVNYNGAQYPAGQEIWKFLHWRYSTNDHAELLTIVGGEYGIQPDFSGYTDEQMKRAQQRQRERALLTDIAARISRALQHATFGATAAAYLNARHLQPTERMGAWSTKIRAAILKHMQNKQSGFCMEEKDAEAMLRRLFPLVRKDYADAKRPVYKDFTDDYQLAIPYYNGSNVVGFCMRCTAAAAPTYTDEHGAVQPMPKYLFSRDMPKGGYCDMLQGGDNPVYMVEGLLDAEAMKQHGFTNVIAVGGQTPTDNEDDAAKSTIKTLQRYGVKKVVYIPDCEYTPEGIKKTAATRRTIAALLPYLNGQQYGAGFASLRIADLETEDSRRNHSKVDADTLLQTQPEAMHYVLDNTIAWYEYELQDIVRQYRNDADSMAAAAIGVFLKIDNPAQRGRLKADITAAKDGYLHALKAAGLTAAELALIERDGAQSTWAARMAEVRDKMQNAKTREGMAALLSEAGRIQNADTYADFEAQANMTREDMHALVADKPDYLQTAWALYKDKYNPATKTTRPYENRKISFAPAAVTIIAAPTNHGKTLVLLQTAIRAAQDTGKRFIYISFENDAEQLYIRALAAYMGKAWEGATIKEDGKQYGIEQPRAELRNIIKGDMPSSLFDSKQRSIDIDAYIQRYWREIAPRLALVRTAADIDAVVNNVAAQVEAWRNAGEQVGGIFIDYLQLLHYPAIHARSRTDEVKGICDRLNDMAKATKLPVILAAQFNRQATQAGGDTLDGVELANIGESSGIENIAEDVYLLWQVDKINPDKYKKQDGTLNFAPQQYRTRRCFRDETDAATLCAGYLYIENLKARDFATGGHCLLRYNGAAGAITDDNSAAEGKYLPKDE